jgi:nucleoside-diphosphate-sugar epimerase
MRTLVTGSSGLLGHCLVSLLQDRGDQLRLLDVAPPSSATEPGEAEMVCADMRDQASVQAAARGIEVIYHLAAAQRMKPQFSALSERDIYDMNLCGVANVLGAAERQGVRKVVFVSSSGVYGVPRRVPCSEDHPTEPLGAYGRSKLEAEGLCRRAIERGLDITVLRPMSLFGPRMTGVFVMLFEWVRTGAPVYMLGRGANRVQMVSALDVADACILAAQGPEGRGGFFNLGAEPALVPAVYEQVRALIEHAGSASRIIRMPAGLLRNAARVLHRVGLSPIVPEHYLLADSTFILDISRAAAVLGWHPRQGNVELMNEAYDWYVRHGAEFRPRPHPVMTVLNAMSRLRSNPSRVEVSSDPD